MTKKEIQKRVLQNGKPLPLRCECPERGSVPPEREYMYSEEEKSGMNHEPNKCLGTNNIKKYRRGDKELYLCSCCTQFGDEEL